MVVCSAGGVVCVGGSGLLSDGFPPFPAPVVIPPATPAMVPTPSPMASGYSIWDGFTNDQPESKKKGITIILVTVFVIIFLFAAKGLILGMVGITA